MTNANNLALDYYYYYYLLLLLLLFLKYLFNIRGNEMWDGTGQIRIPSNSIQFSSQEKLYFGYERGFDRLLP